MIRVRPLLADTRGAAAMEFAIIAPTFAMLLVGGFDIAHTLYMNGVLQGVVQKTARDSALESGGKAERQTAIDNKVRDQVLALQRQAQFKFERRFYRSFAQATAKVPEPWTDSNSNGSCDKNEEYQDNNNNKTWDKDGGDEGQGGAQDRVLYTVTIKYPRMLPLNKFIPSVPAEETVVASAALMNQPFTDQGSYAAPTVRKCV